MKKLKHKQIEFKGIICKIDVSDLPPEHTPDCENVVISTRGELSNIKGMEKQATSAYTNDVVSIHKLGISDTLHEVTA